MFRCAATLTALGAERVLSFENLQSKLTNFWLMFRSFDEFKGITDGIINCNSFRVLREGVSPSELKHEWTDLGRKPLKPVKIVFAVSVLKFEALNRYIFVYIVFLLLKNAQDLLCMH